MMPRLARNARRPVRFDSDAETLPFPEGGVFGCAGDRRVADEAETDVRRMKLQLDDLRREVDVVLHLPGGDSWRPRAA